MRQQASFLSGMVAGIALGAIIAMALSPQARRPVVESFNTMGDRMRRMMRGTADVASAVIAGDAE